PGILEITAQKLFVDPLHQHIKTEVTSVEFDRRMTSAGNGHPSRLEQLAPDFFGEKALILNRIVEVQFFQPMKFLSFGEAMEIKRECRFSIHRPKAAGTAFQTKADIGVSRLSLFHRDPHIAS